MTDYDKVKLLQFGMFGLLVVAGLFFAWREGRALPHGVQRLRKGAIIHINGVPFRLREDVQVFGVNRTH